jgi:hypothetical protein
MEEYRQAAKEAILRAKHEAVLLEHRGSPHPPEIYCKKEVENCDIFVLLLGALYGSTNEEQVSYTEYEHRAALERGLTRIVLILNTPQDAALKQSVFDRWFSSAEQPPEGTIDWQVLRQRIFTQTAVRGVTPYTIKNAQDLTLQLLQALHDHLPHAPAATPLPGELVVHMCNRSDQLAHFGQQFEDPRQKETQRPQIYILFGADSQKHEACVDRLLCYHIKRRFRDAPYPPISPSNNQRVVAWPGQDIDSVRFNRLRYWLFKALDERKEVPTDNEVEHFWNRALALKARYVVLLHILDPDEVIASESLIRFHYLPFWDDVERQELPPQAERPQFLIFVDVKYKAGSHWGGEALRSRLSSIFACQERAAKFTGAVTCLLPELRDVEGPDIEQWVTTYNEYLRPDLQDSPASELFPPPPLSMHTVEKRIRDLLGLLRSHAD